MKVESKLDLQIKVQSAHANKIKSADQTIIPSTQSFNLQMKVLFSNGKIIYISNNNSVQIWNR